MDKWVATVGKGLTWVFLLGRRELAAQDQTCIVRCWCAERAPVGLRKAMLGLWVGLGRGAARAWRAALPQRGEWADPHFADRAAFGLPARAFCWRCSALPAPALARMGLPLFASAAILDCSGLRVFCFLRGRAAFAGRGAVGLLGVAHQEAQKIELAVLGLPDGRGEELVRGHREFGVELEQRDLAGHLRFAHFCVDGAGDLVGAGFLLFR